MSAMARGAVKKAGIAIDSWKSAIFNRHLSQAGYSYTTGRGVTKDTLLLTVETADLAALEVVVRAANAEATAAGARA